MPLLQEEDVLDLDDEFEIRKKEEVRIEDIIGTFETVTDSPTTNPTSVDKQIKVKVDGATKKLQIYSTREQKWYEVTLTEV